MDNAIVSEDFRNRMLVHWAEVGDNVDVVWNKLRKEGFNVDIETVHRLLSGGPNTIYDEPDTVPTSETQRKYAKGRKDDKFKVVIGRKESVLANRKVKLTEEILQIVAGTVDDDDVHSLLSLKRALERKGVQISKTSVFRALEKLGRSIVEKKKKMTPPNGTRTPGNLIKSVSSRPGPKPKPGPKTVAEMLQSQANAAATNSPQQMVMVAANPASINKGNKKLRTLLPKPIHDFPLSPTTSTSGPTSPSSTINTQVGIKEGLMQITPDQEPLSSAVSAATVPNIVNTSNTNTPNNVFRTDNLTKVPSSRGHSHSITLRDEDFPVNLVIDENRRGEERQNNLIAPAIKLEIDDLAYDRDIGRERDILKPIGIMRNPTPPPSYSMMQTDENPHVNERLTKSASPQLQTSTNYHHGIPVAHHTASDNEGTTVRAIQQFRLNKAIGKITNLRSQASSVRAPRKPSVVFHRPSTTCTPIPFKVKQEPASFAKSLHIREDGIRTHASYPVPVSNGRTPGQFHRNQGRNPMKQSPRSLQMMRAARTAQLRSFMRSGLYKLSPSAISNARAVNVANNRRRLARLQRQQIMSPLYYAPDLEEEDFLTELEIDPPDSFTAVNDDMDQPTERPDSNSNENDTEPLLREMFQEMTKEIKKLSNHMETIQGQIQVIVDQLPGFVVRNKRSSPEREDRRCPTENGASLGGSSSPPLSDDDTSIDILEDGEDNLEDISGEEKPLTIVDFRDIPALGTPESDALIREVMEDNRWDQMTPYAGAPRLAIALARYCIFGTKVLVESSVTGRNSKNPLNHTMMRKIKEILKEKYGSRCNQLEFEMVWKTSRESISQLCKRLRRKFQLTEHMTVGQDDFMLDCQQ